MKLVVIVAVLILIALVVRYLTDDYGDYAAWKPGFVRYVSLLIGDYWGEIVRAVTRIPILTTDGVFRFPDVRPLDYFKVGEDVVFINYICGGVISESLPGVAKGVVTAIDATDGIVTFTASASGEEIQFYNCSRLLMHAWEYDRLKRRPILRCLYCYDTKNTSIEGFDDIIKAVI